MKAIVTQSFKLSNIGMACFIKHDLNGLPAGTILTSPNRKLSWRVQKRMLWMHSAHVQRRFSNEKENIGHLGFIDRNNPEEKVARQLAMDAELGYEYLLEPIAHDEKPLENEELIIETEVEEN